MPGIQSRSRALLSDGPTADTLCAGRRSTASGAAASPSISPAPAWVYVEWPRRERRRAEAREHPRAARGVPLAQGVSKLGISSRRQLRHDLALALPDGAPPEATAGDGEFLGTRAGDFDRCERPPAGETLRG